MKNDPHASYNISPYQNYRSVFGWGLWPLPVPTFVSDGCHFNIRYSENYQGDRYEVVPQSQITSTRSLQKYKNNNNNNNISPTMSGGDAGAKIESQQQQLQQQQQRTSTRDKT
uniref:Uncharacterized protein n=1 Tax=Panagrolaimus davidi TaxID=227884 RepID=A0A914PFL9_9BILA